MTISSVVLGIKAFHKSPGQENQVQNALNDQLRLNDQFQYVLVFTHFSCICKTWLLNIVYLLRNKALLINQSFFLKIAINSYIFIFIPGLFHKAAP